MMHAASISLLLSFCLRVGFGAEVSVMEGDSVTLHTDVKTNQQDNWYFRSSSIAKSIDFSKLSEEQYFDLWITNCRIPEITDWEKTWGRFSFRHMDVQCDESFTDRLKLDHQTGSLTIRDSRTTDSGVYYLQDCSSVFNIKHFSVSVHGVPAAERDQMKKKSVKEGESVTLDPDVITNTNDLMKWYFNEILITEITGDLSKICTDVQCKERFRDRLKLDHQTGSLTITNTTTDHTGDYQLQISNSRFSIIRHFSVSVTGFFGIGSDGVSVFMMEGDPVILHTGVKQIRRDIIRWLFNDIRIAQIHGYERRKCTDLKCYLWFNERFRASLNLDHKTGSLTIKNTRTTDAGVYELRIISRSGKTRVTKHFRVSVRGVSAAERDKMKRKSVNEGESVTLHPGVIKKTNNLMTWHFNVTLIAEITGDQSKICTDVQCKEKFGDRLKLDHQTGSLTITNTTNTHSGEYKLKISSSRFSIMKRFRVTHS